MKDTNIELSAEDRQDINLSLEVINTAEFELRNISGFENLKEEEVRNIYQGACDALIEGRVMLHLLRQEFVKKYNIPYDFISIDGHIYLQED